MKTVVLSWAAQPNDMNSAYFNTGIYPVRDAA